MTTTKPLTDLDWTKIAASRDDARPALTAVHVNGHMEATDGYRLHIAGSTGHLEPGLYDARTMGKLGADYRFPNVDQVTPTAEPNLTVENLEGMVAIASAAQAASKAGLLSFVSLPSSEGPLFLNPTYLLDALKGAAGPYHARFQVTIMTAGPLKPAKVVIAELNRTAVLMTVRRPNDGPDPRFDLGEFCQPVAQAVAA